MRIQNREESALCRIGILDAEQAVIEPHFCVNTARSIDPMDRRTTLDAFWSINTNRARDELCTD